MSEDNKVVTVENTDEKDVVDLSKGDPSVENEVHSKVVNYDNGTQEFAGTTAPEKVTAPKIVQGAPVQDNVNTNVNHDVIETPVVIREHRVIDGRLFKADFQKILDDMKKNDPAKYEAQHADIEKQMAAAQE